MSKIIIIENNFDEKNNTKNFMVKGERGYSAYDLYVQNGGTLTEEEWLDEFLNAENFYNKDEVDTMLEDKVDTEDLSEVAISGRYEDLEGKPTIPSIADEYSESEVNGYSANYINRLNECSTTEEIRCGTWIDGKPLYRIAVTYTVISGTEWNNIIELLNIDNIFIKGFSYKKVLTNPDIEERYINNYSAFSFYHSTTDNYLKEKHSTSYADGTILSIIIEYTKTTD